MKASLLKKIAWAVGLGTLYYVSIMGVYLGVIVPVYTSSGMVYREAPLWYWPVSIGLAFFPLFWMKFEFERPSDFASWFLYLCVVAPTCLLSFLLSHLKFEEVLPLPITIVLCYGLFEWVRCQPPFKVRTLKGAEGAFKYFLPALTLVMCLLFLSLRHFQFDLSFKTVYERRLSARELVPPGSPMGYAEALVKGFCAPMLIVLGIRYRSMFYILLAIVASVVLFSFDGEKSVVFAPFILAVITIAVQRQAKGMGRYVFGALILMVVFAIIEAFTIRSDLISSIVIRRQIAMPAQLTTYYWEFFSVKPLVMLSDSAYANVFGHVYDRPTARLIGMEFFNSEDMAANANIWASGFAHFGYAGMAMASVGAGFLLRIADSMSRNGKIVIGAVVCSMIGLIWTNGALHTTFLSGGVGALLVALYFFPAQENELKPVATPVDRVSSPQPAPG